MDNFLTVDSDTQESILIPGQAGNWALVRLKLDRKDTIVVTVRAVQCLRSGMAEGKNKLNGFQGC